jgi:hypothetical protein
MDIRIKEKNKTTLLIKEAENIIKRNTETIKRFSLLPHSTFNDNKIKSMKEQNTVKETYISEMKTRIEKIDKGEIDAELKTEYEINKKKEDVKREEKIQKLNSIAKDKNEKKTMLDLHYTTENNTRRNNKYAEQNMTRAYDYFIKANSSIPDYILKNLKHMPNNKGYIWKGICCYGDLDADSNKVILTEKLYNNVTKIHEWDEYEYIIYTKDKYNNKKILSKKPRNKF